MLPPSTKQLMQQSIPFKFAFCTSIALVIAIIVLGIVSASVTCRNYFEYKSCSYASSYYYNQCYNGMTYCCSSSYSYCGDYYCRTLDSFSYYRGNVCWGIFNAMWGCSALCFFLSIITIALFCNLRKKAQMNIMMHAANQYNNSIAQLYVPPLAFPNQNQPVPVQINSN